MVSSSTLRYVLVPFARLRPADLDEKDNAGVIVNPKGEMKGSAITGPVAKECVRPNTLHVLQFRF